jgi:hypothetical protein
LAPESQRASVRQAAAALRATLGQVASLHTSPYLVIRYSVPGQQGAQAAILKGDRASSALHLEGSPHAAPFVLFQAPLEVIHELFAASPRPPLAIAELVFDRRGSVLSCRQCEVVDRRLGCFDTDETHLSRHEQTLYLSQAAERCFEPTFFWAEVPRHGPIVGSSLDLL